ncbi:hypothetical protein [Acinetobacter sp. YH01022]|uniref:RipA family octameric membrane protein n=1 Tax=Acinetobacter sp. YH01022 TaxID=2601036 RepID=UPI0015D16B2B|nr:hypothetical protein [Acinetobacter sp. YH01022]
MKKPDQNLDEDFTSNHILKLEIKELKAVYERSIATRDFEIQQLQNRNNYFIIFQGVMLSGVLMCAELAGDFHLGDSRQLTDKSLLPFDLVS